MTAPKKSKYTLLLEEEDALAFDRLAYELRVRTGRRVEKSEIVRVLIRLGLNNPATDRALSAALDRRPPQAEESPRADAGPAAQG